MLALLANPVTATVDARQRAILDYVIPLTLKPASATREMVEALRAQGLSDPAILNVNLVASMFNWLNRVVDGLGVPLEDHMADAAIELGLSSD